MVDASIAMTTFLHVITLRSFACAVDGLGGELGECLGVEGDLSGLADGQFSGDGLDVDVSVIERDELMLGARYSLPEGMMPSMTRGRNIAASSRSSCPTITSVSPTTVRRACSASMKWYRWSPW